MRDLPRKHFVIVGCGAILLLAAVMAGTAIVRHGPSRKIVTTDQAQRLLFNVYQPDYLPAGYALDYHSVTIREGVLIFQALNAAGQNIAITEESIPTSFDFDAFYQKHLSNIRNFQHQTPYKVVTGTVPQANRQMLSVQTHSTWIIMTSHAGFSPTDVVGIAKGLRSL